ncbi:uncharacterized protein sypl1 isoform X1 [Oreochromis niloticus]|uniref:uncharacterized protein sypl1 isoform X1 n=1 Tax=Oreochromis niloticus TaxID=8128 RepID=UPI000DF15D67|nr:uncharacterized protein LOC102076255 isoform X1 [Oreochromis niloticus]
MVPINNSLSGLRSTSTGSPQGCVLSPLLFIRYTDDCRSTQPNCHLVKYADDTVLLSLRSGPSQHHGPSLQEFVEWCDSSKLELNVSITKEMVVTFSSRQRDLAASVTTTIHGKPVEVVDKYKYLGTIFDNLLKFSANTEEILRRCHQRLYLLRKLNSFGVNTPIMMTFYYAFLESIMTFSITCWFHSLSFQNKNRLHQCALKSLANLSELWHRFSANRPSDRQPKSSTTPLTFFTPHFNGSPLGDASAAFPAGLRGGEPPLSPKPLCFLTPADKTISHTHKHKLHSSYTTDTLFTFSHLQLFIHLSLTLILKMCNFKTVYSVYLLFHSYCLFLLSLPSTLCSLVVC